MFFYKRKKDKHTNKENKVTTSIFVRTENELRNTIKIVNSGDTLIFLKEITLSNDFVVDKDVNFRFEGIGIRINTGGYELIFNKECNIY